MTTEVIQTEVIQVPPRKGYEIVFVEGPFDTCLAGLAKQGVSLWSAEELAEQRILLGSHYPISTRWLWVAEGLVYMTDKEADILIVREPYNPLLQHPAKATQAHRKKKEYHPSKDTIHELRERAEIDPDKARTSSVYRLRRDRVRNNIPVDALGEYGLTRFLLGEQARHYTVFLQANDITNVQFSVVNRYDAQEQDAPFAMALCVGKIRSDMSSLYGANRCLHDALGSGRVGGVRPSPLEERVSP